MESKDSHEEPPIKQFKTSAHQRELDRARQKRHYEKKKAEKERQAQEAKLQEEKRLAQLARRAQQRRERRAQKKMEANDKKNMTTKPPPSPFSGSSVLSGTEEEPPADFDPEQKLLWETLQVQRSAESVRIEQARCQTEDAKSRTEDAKARAEAARAQFLDAQTRSRILDRLLKCQDATLTHKAAPDLVPPSPSTSSSARKRRIVKAIDPCAMQTINETDEPAVIAAAAVSNTKPLFDAVFPLDGWGQATTFEGYQELFEKFHDRIVKDTGMPDMEKRKLVLRFAAFSLYARDTNAHTIDLEGTFLKQYFVKDPGSQKFTDFLSWLQICTACGAFPPKAQGLFPNMHELPSVYYEYHCFKYATSGYVDSLIKAEKVIFRRKKPDGSTKLYAAKVVKNKLDVQTNIMDFVVEYHDDGEHSDHQVDTLVQFLELA